MKSDDRLRNPVADKNEEDLDLFRFADDPASALEILKTGIEAEFKQATPSIAHSRTAE